MMLFKSSRTAGQPDSEFPLGVVHRSLRGKPRSGVKLNRFVMGAFASLGFAMVSLILFELGLIEAEVLVRIAGIIAISLLLFYLIFRFQLNRQASDPSLLGYQMVIAAFTVLYAMVESEGARAALPVFLAMVMLFGIFRYSTRALLLQAFLLMAAYGLITWWARPATSDASGRTIDLARWIALSTVLLMIAWIGGHMNRISDRLRISKVFFQTIWETCVDAVVVIGSDGAIRYANPAATAIFGHDSTQLVEMRLSQLVQAEAGAAESGSFPWGSQRQGAGAGPQTLELTGVHRDGHPFPLEATLSAVVRGHTSMTVAFLRDISTRRQAEEQIRYLAMHDALTGLPNRVLLNDRLTQVIADVRRNARPVWVVFVDLDRFKFVNDSLGHKVGDKLLQSIADRLRGETRDMDTVARLSGDEFILVLPEAGREPLGTVILDRVMALIAEPMHFNGHEVVISCSVGVAVYPDDGTESDALIEHADIAMYRAKQSGRSTFRFFTQSMNDEVQARLSMEQTLRGALKRGELALHFQPQVDLLSGRIVGAEALLRWQHPELGMVPPTRFIALAEESGLIVPIGAWVLHTACAQAMAWKRAGLGSLRISVNLSVRQFAHPDLVQSIAATLQETGLPATQLDIELTESMVMSDADRAEVILRHIKALGVKLSIDDFGTGYSSLAYLRKFPIDVLKIDKTFVQDLTYGHHNGAIVDLIISLGRNLRLRLIAEGVETAEQLAYLRERGCDEMQGYFFSPAVDAQLFEKMLRDGRTLE